jgi:hypothetical protein
MWILPKQLHTSPFVPDTEALISDSTEQSQICAQSLLARSKPSPARTWSQRWKRDSWTQHLSGRILKPSHGQTFVTAWTSSLAATRASRSQQPASDSEPKTHDTSGLTYQPELLSCDQQYVSLRMSRDISRWGCPTLSKTWADWVTERRGAWRARVNAARLIRGSGSGSWPTATVTDSSAMSPEPRPSRIATGRKTEYLARMVNWPTVTANEDSYRIGGESQQSKCLSAMARRGEMTWTTPTPWQQEESLDSWETRKAKNKAKGYNGNGQGTPLDMQVKILGQAAPVSSSSLGSRQELSVDWRTPQAQEAGAKVETLFTKDGAPAMPGQRAYRKTPSGKLVLQSQTINQQVEMVQNWATPRANERDGTRTPNGNPAKDGIPLGMQARQWGAPTARDHKSGRGNEQREYKELTPMVERRQSGKLNPRWVETLMGLPIGWTMPSCIRPVTIAQTSCDSSGTALCQPSQSERSDFFLAS